MHPFMDALYFYALEREAPRYLRMTEYRQMALHVEEEWEKFRLTLTAGQREKLETLISKKAELTLLEDEAAFSCALSMGITLGRL